MVAGCCSTFGYSVGQVAELDSGERDAIGLALAFKADLLLMDERDGVEVPDAWD